jgi:hypothetical protein
LWSAPDAEEREDDDMWIAKAEYADGTTVERLFAYNDSQSESDQQYQIECWLIERHEGCIWYSVDYTA